MSVSTDYSESASSSHLPVKKDRLIAQKILLGMTAVCAILSCIPPFRLGASLGMRSISLLSVGISKPPAGQGGPFIKAAKLAVVALSIVAVAASMPMLIVASIAADMGLQILEGARALYKGDCGKAGMHAIILVIDTLALAGVILGSWQLMVAAATVSAVAIFVLTAIASATGHGDDAFFYLILMAANVATAATIGEVRGITKTVVIKNDDPTGKLIVMKPVGPGVVAESAPGQDVTIHNNSYVRYNVIHVSSTGETRAENFMVPDEVYRTAISSQELPALPLGGSVLKAVEPNVESFRRQGPYRSVEF